MAYFGANPVSSRSTGKHKNVPTELLKSKVRDARNDAIYSTVGHQKLHAMYKGSAVFEFVEIHFHKKFLTPPVLAAAKIPSSSITLA